MTNKNDKNRGEEPRGRITAKAARRMLGMVGRNYSDEDLETLLEHLYGIAGSAFETYLNTAESTNLCQPSVDTDLIE